LNNAYNLKEVDTAEFVFQADQVLFAVRITLSAHLKQFVKNFVVFGED